MKKENHLISNTQENKLVFGLNRNEEIVQFDTACEQLTGYLRNDVINKKISDFLIPVHYIEQWKKIFFAIMNNEYINDFKIPWKTNDNREVLILWSFMPLNNKKDVVDNICFFGKYLEDYTKGKQNNLIKEKKLASESKKTKQPTKQIDGNIINEHYNISIDEGMKDFEKRIATYPNKVDNILDISKKNKKRNLLFLKNEKNNLDDIKDNKINLKNENKKCSKDINSLIPNKQPNAIQNLISLKGRKSITNSLDSVTMNKKVEELSKKYENINVKIKELEKKDRKLERKNKLLEKNLKNINMQSKKFNITQSNKKLKSGGENIFRSKLPNIFFDPLGREKKRGAFELRMQLLDKRTKELDELETQLIKDRKMYDKKIAEFSTWKEKLLTLESEIEKRRKDIVEQEEKFREHIDPTSDFKNDNNEILVKTDNDISSNEWVDQQDYHMILDKIPQCAAIIQRSIVKQINTSFLDLLGFNSGEIVEKSLFDFIAPDGLAGIEKYYLGRLKGKGSSTYETIFSTKDNLKIPVDVCVKPTIYNGEKAEIAIISEVNTKQEGGSSITKDESVNDKNLPKKDTVAYQNNKDEIDDENNDAVIAENIDEEKENNTEVSEKLPDKKKETPSEIKEK